MGNTPRTSSESGLSLPSFVKDKTTLLALLAILTLTVPGCKQKEPAQYGPHSAGKLSNITALDLQESDAEEIMLYKKLIDYDAKAEKNLETILKNNKHISEFTGEKLLSFDELLPVLIKESRLESDAENASGAQGYGQLKSDARNDVNKVLGKNNFHPETNPSDNLLYSILYFSHEVQQVHTYLEKNNIHINRSEELLFAVSVYNMGFARWTSVYEKAGRPDSRNDFAGYIVKHLMHISHSPVEERDEDYGVDGYKNWFGDNEYAKNNKMIMSEKPGLTMTKAAEVIRYVEVIRALQVQLHKVPEVYKVIEYSDKSNSIYKTLHADIQSMVKSGELKEGTNGVLLGRILLDDNISDNTPKDQVNDISISKEIIGPFLVGEKFKKYSYDVIDYKKEGYLWSIVNAKLKDKEFIKSLGIFDEDLKDPSADAHELEGVMRQYVIEAIVRFNQERRYGWKENASLNVRMPPVAYFKEYNTMKNITSPSEDIKPSVTVINEPHGETICGNDYASAAYDNLGNQPKECGNSERQFSVHKIGNTRIRESLARHGSRKPTMIVIHGTEGAINISTINKINAHFYISKEGVIYQFISDLKADMKSTGITYPDQITALNHAGVGLNNSYGAIRDGNKDKTYEAIGIEVEGSATSRLTPAQYTALSKLIAGLSSSYHIPQKNIVTHSQIAASKMFGRGRKMDQFGLDRSKIGLINNYDRLDHDVINGLTVPNMAQLVRELKQRGMQKAEIKKVLNGMNMSVKKHREKVRGNSSTPTPNKADIKARMTLEQLEKDGVL